MFCGGRYLSPSQPQPKEKHHEHPDQHRPSTAVSVEPVRDPLFGFASSGPYSTGSGAFACGSHRGLKTTHVLSYADIQPMYTGFLCVFCGGYHFCVKLRVDKSQCILMHIWCPSKYHRHTCAQTHTGKNARTHATAQIVCRQCHSLLQISWGHLSASAKSALATSMAHQHASA